MKRRVRESDLLPPLRLLPLQTSCAVRHRASRQDDKSHQRELEGARRRAVLRLNVLLRHTRRWCTVGVPLTAGAAALASRCRFTRHSNTPLGCPADAPPNGRDGPGDSHEPAEAAHAARVGNVRSPDLSCAEMCQVFVRRIVQLSLGSADRRSLLGFGRKPAERSSRSPAWICRTATRS